jgi:hypothetical protein
VSQEELDRLSAEFDLAVRVDLHYLEAMLWAGSKQKDRRDPGWKHRLEEDTHHDEQRIPQLDLD